MKRRNGFRRPTSRSISISHVAVLSSLAFCWPFLPRATAGVTTYGTLCNFDCVNDTGHECHGFEIELEDLGPDDVTCTFGDSGDPSHPYNRYGGPSVVATAGGVIVRYASAYDPVNHVWEATTPQASVPYSPTLGHQCWSLGDPNYPNSGCEHYGVCTARNPTKTTYRWLIEDDTHPGTLKALGSSVNIPAPVWDVIPQPPPGPGLPPPPPVVMALLPAPPALVPGRWGEAIWAKIYTIELPEAVEIEDLVLGGPAVPDPEVEAPEVEWTLLQSAPDGKDSKSGESENGGEVGDGAEAVSRRYEFYKYTGAYDPEDHEAQCDDPLSGDPACGPVDPETGLAGVGMLIGAQNAAVNLAQPEAPTVNCPETITASADPGSCSTSITFSDPTVTPEGTPVTCEPSSGSMFLAGTTSVACLASNAVGSIDCTFDVVVLPDEAFRADLNEDFAIDLADYAQFGPCLAGPSEPLTVDCDMTDLDQDGHLDLSDVAEFLNAFGQSCP